MPFVDTHCHIHDKEFSRDVDDVIARARDAGVELMLTLGTDRASSERAISLARQHDGVFAAAGVHPHDADSTTDADLDALEEMARDGDVTVVGEIGLDFYRNLSGHDRQIAVLRRQLLTAKHVSKPVAVHTREAGTTMLPILTEWSERMGGRLPDGRRLGVMHYFSEDAYVAERYSRLGFIISVHTSVTHPRAETLRDVVHKTPLEHLVIETDSPYGAPQRFRGKRNEPAYVTEAAARIAEIKDVDIETVAKMTTRNARELLGLSVPARGEA